MTIMKHGKFYSDKKEHVDLYGKCSRCGCEFKTFVDLYFDVPEIEGVTLITDPSCKDMKVKPEFDCYGTEWVDGKLQFVMKSGIRMLRIIKGSVNCPDCGELTELKPCIKEDLHGTV